MENASNYLIEARDVDEKDYPYTSKMIYPFNGTSPIVVVFFIG